MSRVAPGRRVEVAPRAAVLVESMRDIGYSLATAIADVIDNAITAGAQRVDILTSVGDAPATIGILDDGTGMTEPDLLEAMRPGTRSPLVTRSSTDLGRFGLGLKTASFSQCRRLTVVTRKGGVAVGAVWDLDVVVETDEWCVDLLSDVSGLPWADRLTDDGTLVIWEKLDRIAGRDTATDPKAVVREVDVAIGHLELVFHRYLSGERGLQRVDIRINGRSLQPFDPFATRNSATQHGQEEVFRLDGQEIVIQPFTLPHHSRMSEAEWKRLGGKEGHARSQGFYLYRNRRLIIHGTWFGLARQGELTKLARVRIDIPNGLDSAWKIDVKKASAQPPAPVREHLRRLVETIGASSRRAYTTRGARLVSDDRMPFWQRFQKDGRVSYAVSTDHPLIVDLLADLDAAAAKKLASVVEMISATLPIDALFADMGAAPEAVVGHAPDAEAFRDQVRWTYLTLRKSGAADASVRVMMQAAEPFRSMWPATVNVIDQLVHEGGVVA